MIPPIVKFAAPILLVCALVTLPRLAVAQMTTEIIEAAKKGAINRQAPRPNAAKLFTDFSLGAEPQRIFGETGEYVFHPEVDHKFKKDVRDDRIVVMRLPSSEEMDNWSRKFREMFR